MHGPVHINYSNDPVQAIMKFVRWLLHLCKSLREFQFTVLLLCI